MSLFKSIIKNILPYFIVKKYKQRKNHNLPNMKVFKQNFLEKSKLLSDNRFSCIWEDIYPCLDDNTQNTDFEPHYTYHPAWASRILARTSPKEHIDIGSTLYFNAYVSAFIPIKFYDYRPAIINLSNLKTEFADITQLPFEDDSIESLSSMHVVEHIGLERYGDPFDPRGDIKAINELQRVLKPGGNLLFVVPIGGTMRIQYNAHRIYTYKKIVEYFNKLELISFTLITDNGQYLENVDIKIANKQKWGCGCFLLTKRKK
jgi:ubiquinone/menaquinone biosynthesis C-methylase UbiE